MRGIVPALCTPFKDGGGLALERVPALTQALLDAEVNGFFVCGSTGEGVAMTLSERKRLAEAIVGEVAGSVPVVVHVGATPTENGVELARHASEIGADAVASVAPIDAPNDLAAAVKHYGAIGSATNLPFYVYWMSKDADRSVTADEFLSAMEGAPNFAGLKFTDTNFYLFQQIVDISGGKLNALTGPDEMCVAGLVMGSDGAIGATYNIMPRLFVGLYRAFHSGNVQAAMLAQKRANRVISLLVRWGVISALKAILGWRGTPVGPPRPPQTPLTNEAKDELKRELEALDFAVA